MNRRVIGPLLGLAIIAAVAAVDIAGAPTVVVTGAVVLGPIACCVFAPPRDTAGVAVVACVVAFLSAVWNDNWGEAPYLFRLVIVIAGGALGVVAAAARSAAQDGRRRFALLASLAEVGEGPATLEETVDAVAGLLVPAFADACMIDVVEDGEPRRLGVRASGPDRAELEAWLLARAPAGDSVVVSSRRAAAGEKALLAPRLDVRELEAYNPRDESLLRLLAPRSAIAVPLRARGRTLGAMSLIVTHESRRRYEAGDAAFAEVMAGRAALALDNAGLSAELRTAEAQLASALGSLADAVLIAAPEGHLVYANAAAAAALGFAGVPELLAAPPDRLLARFDISTEDGEPVAPEHLPGRRVLAGEAAEPLALRFVDRATRAERWNVVKASAVRDAAGRPVLAVTVLEDVTAEKRAQLAQRLLIRAGQVLASSLDHEATLQGIADLVVPELADWAGVSLPDRAGFLRQVAIAHRDPAKVAFAVELAERFPPSLEGLDAVAQVLRDGVAWRANTIPDELLRQSAASDEHYELLRSVGVHAAVAVPLSASGRTIGVLVLATAESRREFDDATLALAEELGRRAGTAVENARLYTERSGIAETLQAGLLPADLPDIPGWSTATLYRPAGSENWVGGDFYEAFRVRGAWMVVMGDVAGRGAQAATLTALARHTLRTAGRLLDSPIDALGELNRELYDRRAGALCTLACALLPDAPEEPIHVVCAGHPPPFHIHEGGARQVGRFGPMIGAFADAEWSSVPVRVAPGDILVLYTDGVIDTEGPAGRFGEGRLHDALEGAEGPADAIARIEAAVLAFERGEQADDTAAVALGRLAVAGDVGRVAAPGMEARG